MCVSVDRVLRAIDGLYKLEAPSNLGLCLSPPKKHSDTRETVGRELADSARDSNLNLYP